MQHTKNMADKNFELAKRCHRPCERGVFMINDPSRRHLKKARTKRERNLKLTTTVTIYRTRNPRPGKEKANKQETKAKPFQVRTDLCNNQENGSRGGEYKTKRGRANKKIVPCERKGCRRGRTRRLWGNRSAPTRRPPHPSATGAPSKPKTV